MVRLFVHSKLLLVILLLITLGFLFYAHQSFYNTGAVKDQKLFWSLIPGYFGFFIGCKSLLEEFILDNFPEIKIVSVNPNAGKVNVKYSIHNYSKKHPLELINIAINESPLTTFTDVNVLPNSSLVSNVVVDSVPQWNKNNTIEISFKYHGKRDNKVIQHGKS